MSRRVFWSVVGACIVLPGSAGAQPTIRGELAYARGHHHYPHGPRVAPAWGYPGLPGGPSVGYPPPGTPGYPACGYPHGFTVNPDGSAVSRAHGPVFHHLPVPVYHPLPDVLHNDDLHRRWRNTLAPGLAGYGFYGLYTIWPRPIPPTVSTRAASGLSVMPAPTAGAGECLTLSVKVPHPSAEVLVDGKKTQQTGTDRTFESPPLPAGKGYAYTVTARWVEGGQTVEVSKVLSGAAGETVRVDFGAPAIATGK